jgi:hypothetical protein
VKKIYEKPTLAKVGELTKSAAVDAKQLKSLI